MAVASLTLSAISPALPLISATGDISSTTFVISPRSGDGSCAVIADSSSVSAIVCEKADISPRVLDDLSLLTATASAIPSALPLLIASIVDDFSGVGNPVRVTGAEVGVLSPLISGILSVSLPIAPVVISSAPNFSTPRVFTPPRTSPALPPILVAVFANFSS